jgi:GDP-4-dehydro-6-deoxy-D-mannose reductase
MEKYLITGISGFVARHFIEFLEKNEIHSSILGIDLNYPQIDQRDYKFVKWSFESIDFLCREKGENIFSQFQPDYVLHLASYSSVAFSWREPIISFQNNTNIFLNLIDSIRKLNIEARVLSVGSSEQYGNVDANDIPLKETHELKPVSPYAVARCAQELLSKIYVSGYGMDIIMTRSFNHVGPWQRETFAIPSFAKQLIGIKKGGLSKGELIVGDLSIIRDFLDVRDVVSAYYQLLHEGRKGEIYNVCSGKGVSLKEIIDLMAKSLNIDIITNVNEELIRPDDNRIIIGSNEKIKKELSWEVKYLLEQSLKDTLDYWNSQSVLNNRCP